MRVLIALVLITSTPRILAQQVTHQDIYKYLFQLTLSSNILGSKMENFGSVLDSSVTSSKQNDFKIESSKLIILKNTFSDLVTSIDTQIAIMASLREVDNVLNMKSKAIAIFNQALIALRSTMPNLFKIFESGVSNVTEQERQDFKSSVTKYLRTVKEVKLEINELGSLTEAFNKKHQITQQEQDKLWKQIEKLK